MGRTQIATVPFQSLPRQKSSASDAPGWNDLYNMTCIPSVINRLRLIVEDVDEWHVELLLAMSVDMLQEEDAA